MIWRSSGSRMNMWEPLTVRNGLLPDEGDASFVVTVLGSGVLDELHL